MSNILVFDASSSWCSVALSSHGLIYAVAELQPRKHAQLMMPMIDEVCRQAGIAPSEIKGIAFGKGPGSFTGLRIAIAIAQGLSLATDAKLYGISSLEALAWQGAKQHNKQHVFTILNAYMGEVFYAAYEFHSEGVTCHLEDALSKPENVDFSILDNSLLASKEWLGAGNGFEFESEFPQSLQGFSMIDTCIDPLAESMVDLALTAWNEGKFTAPEFQEPVYLRDTVAWKKLSEQPSLLKKQ